MFSKRLGELNLTNARLFYKNQVLCNNSLNERQKIKIVESISKVGSVDEVKVLYETLIDSVSLSDKTLGPKSLREAVQNKDALIYNRKLQTQTNNSNPVYNRMQELARYCKKEIEFR